MSPYMFLCQCYLYNKHQEDKEAFRDYNLKVLEALEVLEAEAQDKQKKEQLKAQEQQAQQEQRLKAYVKADGMRLRTLVQKQEKLEQAKDFQNAKKLQKQIDYMKNRKCKNFEALQLVKEETVVDYSQHITLQHKKPKKARKMMVDDSGSCVDSQAQTNASSEQ